MEQIILMNSKWGNDIFTPMYLFFGGLTGGLFIVAVVADLVGIKHKSFEKLSKVVAFIEYNGFLFPHSYSGEGFGATNLGIHLSTHTGKETRYIKYGPLLFCFNCSVSLYLKYRH